VWFEVEVVEAKGRALVGIAGTNFNGFPTVGTDAASWSIYLDTGAGGLLHSRRVPTPILQLSRAGFCVFGCFYQCRFLRASALRTKMIRSIIIIESIFY
jgi:hypothetical protein